MAVYIVWDKEGHYKTKVEAMTPEAAIIVARMSHGIKAAMVQEDQAFAGLHEIKDKITFEHAIRKQALRYAEIKDAEQRTWRDKRY